MRSRPPTLPPNPRLQALTPAPRLTLAWLLRELRAAGLSASPHVGAGGCVSAAGVARPARWDGHSTLVLVAPALPGATLSLGVALAVARLVAAAAWLAPAALTLLVPLPGCDPAHAVAGWLQDQGALPGDWTAAAVPRAGAPTFALVLAPGDPKDRGAAAACGRLRLRLHGPSSRLPNADLAALLRTLPGGGAVQTGEGEGEEGEGEEGEGEEEVIATRQDSPSPLCARAVVSPG